MKISHIMPVEEWAFKYVTENIAKNISEHKHVVNKTGDVRHVLTPTMFKAFPADSKTVLHLDGNRVFENLMEIKQEVDNEIVAGD